MSNASKPGGLAAVDSWIKRVNRVAAVVSAVVIMLMILTTMLDVSRRALFKEPVAGTVEMNQIFMVMVVFLALAYTQEVKGHIRVDFVLDRISPRIRGSLLALAYLAAFAWFAVISVQTLRDAMYSFSVKEYIWSAIAVPIWWAKFFIPIGCWLMCIQLASDVVQQTGTLFRTPSVTPTAEKSAPSEMAAQ